MSVFVMKALLCWKFNIIFDLSFKSSLHVLLQAMSSTEEKAYEIMRELDVDYVLVIFGGLIGYSSDGMYDSVDIITTCFNPLPHNTAF